MTEYIDREATIKKIQSRQNKSSTGTEDVTFYRAIQIIRDQPTEDVQLVKRGQWSKQMLFDDGFGGKKIGYICSACKKYVPFRGNFCGECGADMRNKEE